jgi:predicted flap endonuclease-1-like 5' DNA nuclease
MAIVLIVVLILLGLGLGFILAWILNITGAAVSLAIGLLLVVAGALAGFIIEWLIDESVRKNRELQRQLAERQQGVPIVVEGNVIPPSRDSELLVEVIHQLRALREMPAVTAGASAKQDDGMLAEILRQHNQELRQLGERISTKDSELDEIRRKFESYQKSHPDEFTQIKGIGPVFQRKLRDIGFSSFSQLAQADPAQLRRMLDIKDWQRVDVENWVRQAQDWAEHR